MPADAGFFSVVMNKPLPSQEILKERFDYDPETGVVTYKYAVSRSVKPGDQVGCIDSSGYRVVHINSVMYRLPRIIWMLVYGEDPGELQVDHDNRQRDDNRLSNLYLKTPKGQAINRSTTRLITFENKTMSVSDWADELDIPISTLHDRLNKHSVEIALGTKRNARPWELSK